MKSVLALIATAQAVSPDFESYKAKFDKIYSSEAAEAKAKACWQETVADIVQQSKENSDVRFAENIFSDQCWEEFLAERAPLDASNGVCIKSPIPSYDKQADESKDIDYRTQGFVNPIKDQKSCGSCWAFSAVGAMEGAHFKATGELASLSEQQLVSCDPGNSGCNGGMPGEAFAYATKNGMALEDVYPYEARTSSCMPKPKPISFSNWFYIPSHARGGGEPVLLAALQNEGPMSITINANKAWHSYSGGIMDTNSCPNTGGISHAVLAVGFGRQSGKKYWMVRNSWGTRWGEDGHIRLAYNKGVCSITACIAAVIVGSPAANETVV